MFRDQFFRRSDWQRGVWGFTSFSRSKLFGDHRISGSPSSRFISSLTFPEFSFRHGFVSSLLISMSPSFYLPRDPPTFLIIGWISTVKSAPRTNAQPLAEGIFDTKAACLFEGQR
ncbi:hypothetical protein CEXT_725051 [Caerostris extrusa]|uniref:Uncharacterized protein n=1 Tax=Caerostris extrusa TaxID=172846 RepID=A0AAV4R2I4_CAEEX|nr:hypothetical protein CEXT_725051 [Caerostris extrusa]